METNTKLMGIILFMLVGFTTVIVLDDNGVALEPTHYCESIGIKMYCAKTTDFYCYPKLDTRLGSKKCTEGWKEIPIMNTISKSDKYICDYKGCISD